MLEKMDFGGGGENLAEEERFELSEDFHPRWFSRPVHSTALPPLREGAHITTKQAVDGIR